MHNVYIIQSLQDGSYYKGYSSDPLLRLLRHNNGESLYTSTKMPWQLVYVERMASKREALIRERNLKKITHERVLALIASDKNILKELMKG